MLLLCLLHHAQSHTRDELVEMFLRRMRKTETAARQQLADLRDQHRELEEALLQTFGKVLRKAKQDEHSDVAFGKSVRETLAQEGGAEALQARYEAVAAYHQNNYLPLLWPIHADYRAVLFRLLDLLEIGSATQDTAMLEALAFVRKYRHAKRETLPYEIDLGFCGRRWRTFIETEQDGETVLGRRALEVCVLIQLAEALSRLDTYVEGSESYADYRRQLLAADFNLFGVTGFWGDGKTLIADGTHVELRENNLLGSRHIRLGGYGGIAYHHISNRYIALFCNFIACGVWEGVYILDAFINDLPDALKPDTLHADTQGQSEAVFGLAYLLGIKLMPRMRTWNDVVFYRPDRETAFQHIGALFTETVDWQLIETHLLDMLQVAISIQAGMVLPSMLLKRVNNKKHKLYLAFRELGRVARTLFLLRYVSKPDLRRTIRAETTKIESYNEFLDWICFGGPVIKSGDPVEQTKRIKYTSLVANAIMLQNVVDLTNVINGMIAELRSDARFHQRTKPVYAPSSPPLAVMC